MSATHDTHNWETVPSGHPDKDESSVIHPTLVKVIGATEVALFLRMPLEIMIQAIEDCSDVSTGGNDRTLISRDNFREKILEMAMDEDQPGSQEVIDCFNQNVSEDTFIDLEA